MLSKLLSLATTLPSTENPWSRVTGANSMEPAQSDTSVRLVKDRGALPFASDTEAVSDFDMFPGNKEAKSFKVKIVGA